MAVIENELVVNDLQRLFADKAEIRRIVAEQNKKSGFVPNPTATAQTAQALIGVCLLARGIRPEDNIFSRDIIEAREENLFSMAFLLWDASGFVKRYGPEIGTATVNALFSETPLSKMAITTWGYLETYAILRRRYNTNAFDDKALTDAVTALQDEPAPVEPQRRFWLAHHS